MQNDPGARGVLQETHGFPCSNGVALHVRPLSVRPNGQDASAFTEDNRVLRRQTRKAEDIYTIRGRWSKRRLCTTPRHLCR